MNTHPLSLTVVLFAFNEEDNLAPVVDEVVVGLERLVSSGRLRDYQVVLVDDGSSDGTGGVMEQLAAENARITPMSHGTNRGIGAAVKTGFAAARMDCVSILPADGQVDLPQIVKLLPALEEGADMVVGHFTQRAQIDGTFRIVLSRGLRVLMRAILGTKRPMDGVYLFRRSLLKRLPLKSETFFVNLELPVRAIREGLDVRSVPVEVSPRRSGSSKVLGVKRMARVGGEVAKFRWNLLLEALEKR